MYQKATNDVHLTPAELAGRWKNAVSLGALANWRSNGSGPKYLKVGGRVLYRLADVEAWEKEQQRDPRAAAR